MHSPAILPPPFPVFFPMASTLCYSWSCWRWRQGGGEVALICSTLILLFLSANANHTTRRDVSGRMEV